MFSNLKMPLSDALATSVIGIVTVIAILAVIAVLIILVSKVIRAVESAATKKAPATPAAATTATAPAGVPMPAGMNQGELELVNTDEKTAAIIMAIVSDKSGIPLNRLSFKSIKLVEDKK
jgi:Na+-transporting methylmalonyl-CoA/oxaloacetate decarboxylase gamma subunit